MSMKGKGSIAAGIGIIAFIVLAIAGWIMNLLNVINVESGMAVTAQFIVQCVGILLAPLGALMGWIV